MPVPKKQTPALVLLFAFTTLTLSALALASEPPDPGGGDIGVVEHLGGELPLDVPFRDHVGRSVRLGDYFDGQRPVLLIFGYHTCPLLCSIVQSATADALRNVGWTVGQQFDVVVISIDPHDTPQIASRHRDTVMAHYLAGRQPARPDSHVSDDGWHYLTTSDASASRHVADAAGFRYQYDTQTEQYSHSAVILLTTPQGKLARYLYGIEFRPSDIRFGLLEASMGRSVSTVDRILLYCMHYDPSNGRYVVVATRVMQAGGAVTLAFVVAVLGVLWARERRLRNTTTTRSKERRNAWPRGASSSAIS
jgi:protein SCO1